MKETRERRTRRSDLRPNTKLMLRLETRLSLNRRDSTRCLLQRFLTAEWLRRSTVALTLSQTVACVAVLLKSKRQTSCSNNRKLGIESVPETRNKLLTMLRVNRPVIFLSRPLTSIEDHDDLIRTWVVNSKSQVPCQPLLRWTRHLQGHTPLKSSPRLKLPQLADARTCPRLCTAGTLLKSLPTATLCHLQLVLSALVDSRNWVSRSCTEYF